MTAIDARAQGAVRAANVPIDGWARRRARVTREIERIALDLLARSDDGNVTVEQIAAAAAISERTFYRYFPSRDDVFLGLARRLHEITCERVAARPAHESVLDAFIAAVHDGMDPEDEDLIRLWAGVLRRGLLPSGDASSELVSAYREVIAVRLRTEPDDLRVEVFANAIASVMWSTFLRWLARGGDEPLPQMIEDAFDTLARLDRDTGA
ncbi:MAG TPA: TetR family transcriptional regulator [Acidimicrobiia bacterium]|nr:TetR family transcriptional regulator [Acidimicrobiia bacterium]